MQRIFLSDLDGRPTVGMTVTVQGPAYHYLVRVLRLRAGDRFVALPDRSGDVDWRQLLRAPEAYAVQGQEWVVEVARIGGQVLYGTIVATYRQAVEPGVRVTVGQALLKGDKFDLVIQKCTELGCLDIVPLATRRSEVRLEAQRAEKRRARWQRIAREAAEQSRRTHQPLVHPVMELGRFLEALAPERSQGELRLVAWERETQRGLREVMERLAGARPPAGDTTPVGGLRRVVLLIGPEGGLEEGEVELAVRAGFVPVSLGPRVLRAETASIAALTMVLYQLGELGGR